MCVCCLCVCVCVCVCVYVCVWGCACRKKHVEVAGQETCFKLANMSDSVVHIEAIEEAICCLSFSSLGERNLNCAQWILIIDFAMILTYIDPL